MIIYTMNDEEIKRNVMLDFPELLSFSDRKDKDYRRAVLKADCFPYYMTPIRKKTKSGNTWYLLYEARSKRDRKQEPRVSFVTFVDSPKGLYAILPTSTNETIHLNIYTPHFFSRYRERFGIDLPGKKLLLRFFQRNYNYTYSFQETKIDENHYMTEVFGSCQEGIALGVLTLSKNIFLRTFITEEMLKGEQIERYIEGNQIRKEIHESE